MSQITLDSPGQHHYIRSVSEAGIRIGDQCYREAILLAPDQLIGNWKPPPVEQLQAADFEAVWSLQPEVVLVGTGAKQHFLHPQKLTGFFERGIGVEMMATKAACRTFNVLVLEGRRVVAALYPL